MRDYLLHHLLENSAKRHPRNVAFAFKGDSLTYEELEVRSAAFARTLRRKGTAAGDRIGIFLNKSLEMVVALFGILKAGAIYVPIDPSAPAARVGFILRHCGIERLVTSARNLENLFSAPGDAPAIRTAVLVEPDGAGAFRGRVSGECIPWSEAFDLSGGGPPAFDGADTAPAYILHTSGSTGNPKGVVLSHRNALSFVRMAADFFDVGPEDRFCSHAPLHFDLSVFDIFVGARCGGTVVLQPERYSTFPAKLAEFIEKERISVWNSVSSVLALLADKGALEKRRLDALRIVHFSGDVLPVKALRLLRRSMPNASFYNIYGQTEANSSMCYPVGEIPSTDSWRIPIGKAFPNFDVFALGESGEPIRGPGEEGELYVDSSTVALGYWDAGELTDEKFVPDPRCPSLKKTVYRTGDLVRMDEQGNYVFTGRKDQMVKSRGYRIELEEVESVLSGHPRVKRAVVVPIPDELIGNRIVAVVMPEGAAAPEKEDLLRHCAASLPKYMIPESIDFRDSLPTTSTGKIDRRKVRDGFLNNTAGNADR